MRRLLSNRRGLLTGAAAVVGAGLARLTGADRAEATSGTPTTQGAMILGANTHVGSSNFASTTTDVFCNVGTAVQSGFRVQMQINGGSASARSSSGDSIQGHTIGNDHAGVFGYCGGGTGFGVFGEAELSGGSYGVKGLVGSDGPGPFVDTGVWGTGIDATGVAGTSTNRSGVFGISGAVGPGLGPSFGVHGTSANNIGTFGSSTNNIGVQGLSSNNYGVQGVTLKTGYAGLVGVGSVAGSAGFYALGVAGGTAGTFAGDVVINGSLTVTGSYPKSAAVKKRDGTLARMYCQESPEPWFEDFGTATLANGQASVALSADFDEVVNGNDYRVFLTEIGDCGGLYVSRKGPHRFEVRSRAGAATSGSFDYRVVARRLDDVGKRMEKVEAPAMAPIDVSRFTGLGSQPAAPPKTQPGAR
jgi:hypothetical protein